MIGPDDDWLLGLLDGLPGSIGTGAYLRQTLVSVAMYLEICQHEWDEMSSSKAGRPLDYQQGRQAAS